MKLNLKRAVVMAAATAVIGSGLAATAANAVSIGGLSLTVPSGTTASIFNMKTQSLCPTNTGATRLIITMTQTAAGAGTTAWPSTAALALYNNTLTVAGDTVNTGVPVANSLDALAQTAGLQVLAGTYLISGKCTNTLNTLNAGTFDNILTVTGTAATANPYTSAPQNISNAVSSTTVLTVAPAAPVTAGTNVTMTATVSSTGNVAGNVDFFDGTTKLNSAPVAVTAGVATFSTTALVGNATTPRSLTAVFTSTDAGVTGSTSAAVSYQVNPAPAQPTTTTLAATAGTTNDPVVLTATVAPAAAAGTVNFAEGSTALGSAAVVNGVATLSLTGVSQGAHTYTATFVSANTAAYLGSGPASTTVTVNAFAGYSLNGVPGSGENIVVTIAAGTLTLSAATTTVDLGTATIDGTKNVFVTAPKNINPVTVVDTRAGQLGYTVSGIAGDFTGSNVANKINSENLGWTPALGTVSAGVTATAGAAVAPGVGVAVGAVSNPVQGLKASRTLGTAAAGASVGSAVFNASLVLQAPLSTKPDTYSTSLVITAI